MSGAETPTPNAFDIRQEAGKKTEALVFNPEYAQDLEKNDELKSQVEKSKENFKKLEESVNRLADSKLGIDLMVTKIFEGSVGVGEHNQIVREGEALLEELRGQHIAKLKSVMDSYAKGPADPIGLDRDLAEKAKSMDEVVKSVIEKGNIDLGRLRATVEARRKSPEQLLAESNAKEEAAAKKAADEAAAKKAAEVAPGKPENLWDKRMREAGVNPDDYKTKGTDRSIGVLGQEKQ